VRCGTSWTCCCTARQSRGWWRRTACAAPSSPRQPRSRWPRGASASRFSRASQRATAPPPPAPAEFKRCRAPVLWDIYKIASVTSLLSYRHRRPSFPLPPLAVKTVVVPPVAGLLPAVVAVGPAAQELVEGLRWHSHWDSHLRAIYRDEGVYRQGVPPQWHFGRPTVPVGTAACATIGVDVQGSDRLREDAERVLAG
jgi:hypothetical protein